MTEGQRLKLLKWMLLPFLACGYVAHFFALGFNTGRQTARRQLGAWVRGEL